MGPRAFTRGNEALEVPVKMNPIDASMGPRAFTRGNLAAGACDYARIMRLQWGRGLSPAETRGLKGGKDSALVPASMGPRAFTRGNGGILGLVSHGGRDASMGPRAFTRGNRRLRNLLSG